MSTVNARTKELFHLAVERVEDDERRRDIHDLRANDSASAWDALRVEGALTAEDEEILAEAQRTYSLEQVRFQLGYTAEHLHRVERLSTEPPTYLIHGALGRAQATSAQLGDWTRAKGKFMDATGKMPTRRQSVVDGQTRDIKWDLVAASVLNAAIPVDVGDDATTLGRAKALVLSMVDAWEKFAPMADHDTASEEAFVFIKRYQEAHRIAVPYLLAERPDELWIPTADLTMWASHKGNPINQNEISTLTAALGGHKDRFRVSGSRRSFWVTSWPLSGEDG